MGATASMMYSRRREPRHPDEQCALRSARTLRRDHNMPYGSEESWTCGLTNAQIERVAVKYRNIGESEAAVLSELRAGIRSQRLKARELMKKRMMSHMNNNRRIVDCNLAHDLAACTGDLGPRCGTTQGHVVRCPYPEGSNEILRLRKKAKESARDM